MSRLGGHDDAAIKRELLAGVQRLAEFMARQPGQAALAADLEDFVKANAPAAPPDKERR